MSEAVTHYRDRFEQLRPRLPGATLAWLDSARREALEEFERSGFPKPRDEDWKYTRVAPIEKRAFEPLPPDTQLENVSTYLLDEPAHQLVFVDGRFRAELSVMNDAGAGVRIESLASAIERTPDVLEAHLNQYADPHRHAFTQLNTAFTADGAFIAVNDGISLERPVHLLFLASGVADTVAHPRVVIASGRNSRLTVVESYLAAGESAYFNNALTEVLLADGAELSHYKVQREAQAAFHVSTLQVQQQSSSRFVSHSASLGAALSRHDINVLLDGEGAECTLNGLYMGRARQHVDYHTRVDHAKARCTSMENYKGILSGRAHGVFNGRVYVHPNAQQTNASQSNKNLLLSRDAEVDTKPQLEIHADDVKCSHGATVGQLDEQMVFYLRSRGLAVDTARALLTYGFARDVVDRMEVEPVRRLVADALLDRMPHADELRSMLS